MSIKNKFAALAALLSIISVSCNNEESTELQKNVIVPRVLSFGDENAAADADQREIKTLHACLFNNGILTRVYPVSDPAMGLELDTREGRLYMVANLENDQSVYNSEGMSEEEWLAIRVPHEGGVNLDYMSGVIDLSHTSDGILRMSRGVSRIDLNSGEGITVNSILFKNISKQSFLNKQDSVVTPQGSGINDVAVKMDAPLSGKQQAVAFLCEQASDNISALLSIDVDGNIIEKEVAMPAQLKRNCIYTLNVYKQSFEADVVLSVSSWENGGGYDLAPNQRGLKIDMENTEFPYGTEVDDTYRSVILPHRSMDFVLAVDCDDELEYIPNPDLPVVVERLGGLENIGKNLFRITKGIWRPGMEYVKDRLYFHRKGLNENYPDDSIGITLSANPVKIQGMVHFVDGFEYDFGRYIDNELARLTVPADKSVAIEYEDGEGRWINLDETEEGVLRILGGWRPNDPTADGRKQVAKLVITNKADGSEREEYTIARRNWGLPVTKLNGVWWCKYNARGNSKDFNDQILSSNDPAAKAGKTVFDYLRDCSAEEYFDLWKWQYLGDRTEGLQVIDDNGVAKLKDYAPCSVHINKIDPKSMAPDGYELPTHENFNRIFESREDYVWIMWDGGHTSPWNGGTNIQRRQRRRNDVSVGTVVLDDLIFISMYSNSQSEYEPLVWYGSSAQWNNDGIKHGHYNAMLWAMHSQEGTGWYFNGSMAGLYLTKNNSGSDNTRLVRFKKSDVEYIY